MDGTVLFQTVKVIPGGIHFVTLQQVSKNLHMVFKFMGALSLQPEVCL
ncbi:MAG: hypothetical protein ACI4EC_10115 [Lachnospiraceae bacterium]